MVSTTNYLFLAAFNIKVIILPAHCTHILQLFDVGLDAELKERFTEIFLKLCKNKQAYIPNNMAATMRKFSITAFIASWNHVCVLYYVEKAALQVGIKPYNPDIVKQSPFVREFTDEEREIYNRQQARLNRRFNINNLEITLPPVINQLRTSLQHRPCNEIICKMYPNGYAAQPKDHMLLTVAFYEEINKTSNDRWLSRLYPFKGNVYRSSYDMLHVPFDLNTH